MYTPPSLADSIAAVVQDIMTCHGLTTAKKREPQNIAVSASITTISSLTQPAGSLGAIINKDDDEDDGIECDIIHETLRHDYQLSRS